MLITVLFYIFVAVTVIQFIYYLLFSLLPFRNKLPKEETKECKGISVIVYIKNNANELVQNLPAIINQKYSNFEIVLVNHASYDASLEIMTNFQQKHSNIKIVNVENQETFWDNKKYALTLAIKASTNSHFIFADINSKPFSNYWIEEVAQKFTNKKTIVIGYQKLIGKKYSASNLFIRFVHTLNALKTFTLANFGSPYKAHQGNFAYSKELFFNVKGFINHLKLSSGESDLFLKDAATSENTAVLISPNSFVTRKKIVSLHEFVSQQKTQAKLFSLYTIKNKIVLSAFNLSKILFIFLAVILSFFNWIITLPVIVFYFVFQYILVGKAINRLKEPQLLYFLPILDSCYVFFVIYTRISNTISKPTL